MSTDEKILTRLTELIAMGDRVLATQQDPGPNVTKRAFGPCTTFNRFAGLGPLHALRTLVFRSRTGLAATFSGAGNGSVSLGGAGRQCIEAVLPLATDEVRVDVRAPSRSAVFRYGQHVSAMERVFTRHNPLVFQVRETV